jgi:hypothetical protein
MYQQQPSVPGCKISRELAARLGRLHPEQPVRAIVMLDTGAAAPAGRSRGRREAAVAAVRHAADAALPDLDEILQHFDGRRLAAQADALGCVLVEATPKAIAALADSEHVKAIFEDQPISLVR